MVTELLQKYIWLVQTFIRAGERGLSLGEISDRWENRFDSPYSRRTFNNHRAAIEEVFGIHIDCDRSSNRYFIGYADDVSDDTAENAWLINTFTVNNILSLRKERNYDVDICVFCRLCRKYGIFRMEGRSGQEISRSDPYGTHGSVLRVLCRFRIPWRERMEPG